MMFYSSMNRLCNSCRQVFHEEELYELTVTKSPYNRVDQLEPKYLCDTCFDEIFCCSWLRGELKQRKSKITNEQDIVKEIYKKLKEDRSRHNIGTLTYKECDHLIDFVKYLCKKSGMEVN